jgi:hypothetical protein
MGLLAQISTETGATVMVNHHMAKVSDNDFIDSPEKARNKIRGTSAIVDGVRCAFSVWQVDEPTAKSRCKDLQVPYTRNAVFDGAVVKANGPANREIRHFIRNPDTGLLEDRSIDIRNFAMSQAVRERIEYVFNFIRSREDRGIPVTKGGMHDGIFDAIRTAPNDDINAGNLRNAVGESTIKKAVTTLQNDGRIDQFKRNRSGPRKWLGVVGGQLNQEEDILD